jgi:hypothetical protein
MPPPPDPVNPPTGGSHEAGLIETPCFIQPLHWNIAVVGPIPTCHIEF